MKKIRFSEHILPHIVAIAVFLLVTIFFFSPVFFENKSLMQHDIDMSAGSSKSIRDYRGQTGEEALWADAMFSGMPAYLVSVKWSNGPVTFLKSIMSLGLPYNIANIFIAFLSYYIMLLSFRVRPYLAIAGAIAFGLSTYMIIGLSAGHNGRIGAIAFMPMVIAGIHLTFTHNKLLGAAITAAGMALHLRDNHVQMTYYMMFVVLVYGLIRLAEAVRNKTLPDFFKTLGVLLVAVAIGVGTFFGQLWALNEYSAYSSRGKSDLAGATPQQNTEASLGMSREYAFEFSNGILEPLTLMIPNIYGGSSSNYLFLDQKSESYKALARSGNQQTANQLANYTRAYWGEQRLSAPYYAGAVIVFLFALGIAFAEKKYVWWLGSMSLLGIVLSWGSNFAAFNYFMFDYFPGYDKFRSVTFALILPLLAMPLLGLIGLENLWATGLEKNTKRKLLIVFGATGGLCLVFWMFAGIFSFMNESEAQLPVWFTDALAADRKSLLRSDALRSFGFILVAFALIYFDVHKKVSPMAFFALLILIVTIDLAVVNKRFLTKENYKRSREATFNINPSDQVILNDKSYFRVYNLGDNPFAEARTSYFHKSVGGYHGAKLRRYADFYDSCMVDQTQQFITQANEGALTFDNMSAFNMLNVKYILFGPQQDNVIPNPAANGNAWFVQEVVKVNSPAEELARTCAINSKTTAVIDVTQFQVGDISADTAATIKLTANTPRALKFESNSAANGLAVFSEIYYPKGWVATIDGKESNILRVNYILRGLEIPAGRHTIEMRFDPKPYVVGNKVVAISSWLVVMLLIASIGLVMKDQRPDKER